MAQQYLETASNIVSAPREHWSAPYLATLDHLVSVGGKLVAYQSENADVLIENAKRSQTAIELRTVILPRGNVAGLPVRALGMAATALNYARQQKERGLKVSTLRILSPVEINHAVNGGDLIAKRESARQFGALVQTFATNYYPDLTYTIAGQTRTLGIIVETGNEIDDTIMQTLLNQATRVKTEYPHIAAELAAAGQNHQDSDSPYGENREILSLAYLIAHPEAWGYRERGIVFPHEDTQQDQLTPVINVMPQSELRYLAYMQLVGLCKADAPHIATLISALQEHPPYYPIRNFPANRPEPKLSHLLEMQLQEMIGDLRADSNHGRSEVQEVIDALNQIKLGMEIGLRERKRLKLRNAPTLKDLIAEQVLAENQ